MIFVSALLLCLTHLVLQTEARHIREIKDHGNVIVEGDILITEDEPPDNEEVVAHLGGDISKRTAVKHKRRLWPKDDVPYELSNNFTLKEKQFITDAIKDFNLQSCVYLRHREESDTQWVKIVNWFGCFSAVGYAYWSEKSNEERIISLNKTRCLEKGIVHHEILHTLGFYHEHSNPNRDNYVKVNWENIIEGKEHNFVMYHKNYAKTLGKYEYRSLMHYSPKAFSKNGKDTIVPIKPLGKGQTMGQKKGMTKEDIKKLNELYNCKNEGNWKEWSNWSKCRKGKRERKRECYYPLSEKGAKKCKGKKDEKKKCEERDDDYYDK